jgi:hypothetical protein
MATAGSRIWRREGLKVPKKRALHAMTANLPEPQTFVRALNSVRRISRLDGYQRHIV